MKIKVFFAAIILALALPAAAQFRTISEAYEIELVNLRLPQRAAGTIAFRKCDTCEFLTKRIGDETRWILNGKTVAFDAFRAALGRVRERDNRYAIVLHHLESDRITQVSCTII